MRSPARSVYDDRANVPAVTVTAPAGSVSARSARVYVPEAFMVSP